MTDLPAPPLVEKTVITLAHVGGQLGGGSPGGAIGTTEIVSATRSMASRRKSWSAGSAITSRTPARRACCNIAVVSSSTTMSEPTSGR